MMRTITERDLREDSGAIMRGLDAGESFLLTRSGVPVGELRPVRNRFVPRELLLAAFADAPRIDAARFRRDVDDVHCRQDLRTQAGPGGRAQDG
jgi:antitoxin (DNA-binding transcriptional repressor) of toxin-antitoxin stability system